MPLLFVYGSLKRGHFNHDRFGFDKAATLIGTGFVKGVSLVRLGDLPYPHAFSNEGGEVVGELFDLDDKDIADSIDWMEQGAGYEPLQVKVFLPDGVRQATMYVATPEVTTFDIRNNDGTIRGTVLREW